jgi:ketosteroid isomerase-like protein
MGPEVSLRALFLSFRMLQRLFQGGKPVLVLLLLVMLPACHSKVTPGMDEAEGRAVQDSVRQWAARMAQDVTNGGPKVWLQYFARSPQFFMASEGKLLFPSNDSADAFVRTLETVISSIDLRWGSIRVDPLASNLALMAAPFHEAITDTAGHVMPADGFFTAIAERTPEGWRLRNAHWSLVGRAP